MLLTEKQGEFLVRTARKVVERYVKNGELAEIPETHRYLNDKRGVFVTLETYPEKRLRGCIGVPLPVYSLKRALQESAVSAAAKDPRFRPVCIHELKGIVVEVSVMTVPEKIKVKSPKEYAGKIRVGEDGLIARSGMRSGLLLPQVAPEHGMDAEEFLGQVCIKAGLSGNAWIDGTAEIEKFRAQIFCEEEPEGRVTEKRFV